MCRLVVLSRVGREDVLIIARKKEYVYVHLKFLINVFLKEFMRNSQRKGSDSRWRKVTEVKS